jgi:hypothetical protein
VPQSAAAKKEFIGALRSESHVDRKLSAAETVEAKRYRRIQSLAKRVASDRSPIR